MERGVGMASSDPLGGSNFRESHLIGIKSVLPSHSTFKSCVRILSIFTHARSQIIHFPPSIRLCASWGCGVWEIIAQVY
jgi:hypothetical protein